MEVKVVRLLSGEDVIAKVETLVDGVRLYSPVVMQQVPAKDGQVGFGFIPWPLFADKSDMASVGVEIRSLSIVMIYSPMRDIEQQYVTATTGLVLPSRSGLILG